MAESSGKRAFPKLPNFNLPNIPGLQGMRTTVGLVVAVVLIVLGELIIGQGGFVEVEPGEVAVIYNNTGIALFGDDRRTITDQGARTFIPGLQSVIVLERRPQVFVMSTQAFKKSTARRGYLGEVRKVNVAPSLTVRANDGSNFFFERLEIHYQLIPQQAAVVVETSGPADGYKENLILTFAREILRDEFGRYTFLEVADPGTYGAATTEAKERLNKTLGKYGVEVTQIVTPKPSFDAKVERAIEARQNAEQEVEVQEEKRNKLDQEKGLKIQGIAQEKNAEYQTLVAELESQKKAADNRLLSVKREADKYFIERKAAGEAYRQEKVLRAKANEIAYRKEAEGLIAKITAVGAAGPDVLNRVIAEKVFPQLKRVSATPLVKPASPIDIRHIEGKR